MTARDDILAANARYAEARGLRDLPGPPARRVAVVTCMDSRIVPLRAFGLDEGDAHVLRNAGAAVSDDVLRSLTASHWELGTQEVFVIAHTKCGMGSLTDDQIRDRLAGAGVDAGGVEFLTFADVDEHVREGMRRIRESPLLPDTYAVWGFVFDVETGLLRAVE